MRSAILKGVCLIAMAGCESEAPVVTQEARERLTRAAERADRAIENAGDADEAPACRRGERRIYACSFGDRQVAVCATDRRLSYRFGTSRRTDLEIDSRPGHVRAYVGGVVGGGGGSQSHIRFTNNGYQYVVHSMEQGRMMDHPGRRSSGVTVMHGETEAAPVVRSLDCPRTGDVQMLPPGDILPAGTFATEPEQWNVWF